MNYQMDAGGFQFPDANPARFALDRSGVLVLNDLAGAKRCAPDASGGSHLELARSLCDALLNAARRQIVPADVRSIVANSKTCAELVRGFGRAQERY